MTFLIESNESPTSICCDIVDRRYGLQSRERAFVATVTGIVKIGAYRSMQGD